MDFSLRCNFKKCRKVLSAGQAWVTSCSHLFCPEDGENYLAEQQKCPVCDHVLASKLDIVRVDLNPSEAYKSMVLCGLHPDVINDISSRAMNFWLFQNHQESLLKEHQLNKISDKYAKMEKYCNKMMNNWQQEAKSMSSDLHKTKNELESSKRQCEELNELLRDKTRQLQKVLSSYSAHRHTAMQMKISHSPTRSPNHDKRARPEVGNHRRKEYSSFDIPFGVATVQHSPPEKDKFETAFCFNVSSIPSSPMVNKKSEPLPLVTDYTECDASGQKIVSLLPVPSITLVSGKTLEANFVNAALQSLHCHHFSNVLYNFLTCTTFMSYYRSSFLGSNDYPKNHFGFYNTNIQL